MKANRIFKTLALPVAAAMMLLSATSCSSEDKMSEEPTNKVVPTKGYAIPVTVKVNRQGNNANGTTRATYDSESKTLSFSAGDQLFICGTHADAGAFAGTLTYSSTTNDVSTFEGTIYAENSYSGNADALLTAATSKTATLLPSGYSTYGYLSVSDAGTASATLSSTATNAIVAGDKALGVEQLSLEQATTYSSGFSLAPQNAILYCNIADLKTVYTSGNITVSLADGSSTYISKEIAASNTFTMAVPAAAYTSLELNMTDNSTAESVSLGDKTVAANKIYNIIKTIDANKLVNLANVTENTVLADGSLVTGTLGSNVKISIAAGATVTLQDVSINADGGLSADNAGITCLGSATINLEGTNTVKGFAADYPGIQAGSTTDHTLTIQSPSGTGKLTASSHYNGAGIGSGNSMSCGNITINSGTVTATGNTGIGAGVAQTENSSCGAIDITGGTVTATGNTGIGAGYASGATSTCGNINISGGTVKATGGNEGGAGIGGGNASISSTSSCGAVNINGGTVTATGGEWAAGIGGGRALDGTSTCGAITISAGIVEAKSIGYAAGIGGGYAEDGTSTCGAIKIEGGTVTATSAGADAGAGIGGGYANGSNSNASSTCGAIEIEGGTVTATGGVNGAGIGGGYAFVLGGNAYSTCASINITSGVTQVVATKGSDATDCIGKGYGLKDEYAQESCTATSGVYYYEGGTWTAGSITIDGGLSDTTDGNTRTIQPNN